MEENKTYMTTDELAVRIKYDARTIWERPKDSVLLDYICPFGGFAVPMANGGVCHG